jgi:hypothetical protein
VAGQTARDYDPAMHATDPSALERARRRPSTQRSAAIEREARVAQSLSGDGAVTPGAAMTGDAAHG